MIVVNNFRKNGTRVRKYARYGKTSHTRVTEMQPLFRIFQGVPENTKIYFNPIKIDPVRAKTVKTRYARGRTEGVPTAENRGIH